VETTSIDKEVIRLSGKKIPRVLFVPTASSDSQGYADVFAKHYGEKLGCVVDNLWLYKDKLSREEIVAKIFNSDIVYVGGGNTLKMMKLWRKLGIDRILKDAADKGVIMAGLSAGAICWFEYGNSDSRKFKNPQAPLIKVTCLGWIEALLCPHYDIEVDRKPDLKRMMMTTPGVAVALDNCTAIEVVDDQYRIITSKNTANSYKVYWKRGEFFQEKLDIDGEYRSLRELVSVR
jgi:dipeptidase E